jgi:hypothetical protein
MTNSPLSPRELATWLVDSGYAVERRERLMPTLRGLELAAGLDQLG